MHANLINDIDIAIVTAPVHVIVVIMTSTIAITRARVPEAYWERAMLDMEEGYLEDAVQGFDLCISADEMYVNGRFFKARCLEAMGKVDQALTEYKSYLPLSPDTAVTKSVEGIIERLESDLSGSGI